MQFPKLKALARFAIALAGLSAAVAQDVNFRLVAVTGDPAPGGGQYVSFSAARISEAGGVAFLGLATGNDERIWAGKAGSIVPIAATVGTLFDGLGIPSINSSGQVAFFGESDGFSGIFVGSGGPLTPAFFEDDEIPGSIFFYGTPGDPILNDNGQIAVKTEIYFGDFDSTGIVIGPPGNMPLAMREGDPLPPAGAEAEIGEIINAQTGDQLDFNEGGQVIFKSDGVLGAETFRCLISGASGNLQIPAREGNPAPGFPGSVFGTLPFLPSINNSGLVAFAAAAESPGSSPSAIFAGAPTAVAPVLKQGDAVPSNEGVQFTNFSNAALNDFGDIAFAATFRYPNNGVRRGIFVKRSGQPANFIVSDGSVLPGPGGATNGVSSVAFAGTGAFNNDGQLVFIAHLDTGNHAVYIAETDVDGPVIRVRKPSHKGQVTMEPLINVSGVARDKDGVSRVEFATQGNVQASRLARKAGKKVKTFKAANGTTNWRFRARLGLGANVIKIRAFDGNGNASAATTLKIVRYECKTP